MNSGIYELTYATCKLYVGQTSRSLKQRYQKHVRYIKQNGAQSAYVLHILNNKYEYGPINNTMYLLSQVNKGPSPVPFEQFYMQSHYHHNIMVPEQYTGERNPI